MRETSIEIEVISKAEDYRRVLFQQQWKRVVLVAIVYLLIVTPIIWFVMFGAGGNTAKSENNAPIFVFGLFGILPLLMAASIYIGVWKQAKKIEKKSESAKFTFTEQGLEAVTDSTSTKVGWNRIAKIKETNDDFIFYPQENVFYTIPKRFFQNENQISEFKQLLRKKIGETAKLKN